MPTFGSQAPRFIERDDAISRCGKRDRASPAPIAFTQTVETSGSPIALEMERGVPLRRHEREDDNPNQTRRSVQIEHTWFARLLSSRLPFRRNRCGVSDDQLRFVVDSLHVIRN